LLTHKPALFLQRYGSYLSEEHLAYFDEIREENYEVDFYLKEARQIQCRFVKGQVVRNRRYRAMQDMIRWADVSNYIFFFSTLFHLPPFRFHCVGGCWDRTQDCCDFCIDSQTL